MAEIHRWQHQYLGANTFPKTLSVVEFRAFFTFSEDELVAIRKRFRTNLRVAGALQLGFLKMTGSLLEHTHVIPSKLLSHIAVQLELPAVTISIPAKRRCTNTNGHSENLGSRSVRLHIQLRLNN